MLDSLVRVSRRVGQVACRFATDPRRDAGPSRRCGRAVRGHWNQSPRVERNHTTGGRRRSATVFLGPPTGRRSPGLYAPAPRRRSPCPGVSRRRTTTGRRRAPPWVARPAPTPHRRTESDGRTIRSSPFASRRFHVLLNSLFKVLFNFPSRYLFAIGLVPVFSLRWSLPPALGCNLKQPDSEDSPGSPARRRRGLTPALGRAPIRRTRAPGRRTKVVPNTTVPAGQGRGIRCWAIPASLAVTEGILVSFFSSA
jgi:hypothetical protein